MLAVYYGGLVMVYFADIYFNCGQKKAGDLSHPPLNSYS
jgi:hypothetical protein